jgi:molybdopterin synthase sulfur carrier subunit
MKVNVLFFGELRETLGTAAQTVEVTASAVTVTTLIDTLSAQGQPWQSALTSPEPLRIAVNQEMAHAQTPLADGAEVALFRPVTGG